MLPEDVSDRQKSMLPPGRERFGFSQTRKPSQGQENGRRQGKGKVTNRGRRYSRYRIPYKPTPWPRPPRCLPPGAPRAAAATGVPMVDCAPFEEHWSRHTWARVIAEPVAARSMQVRSAKAGRRIRPRKRSRPRKSRLSTQYVRRAGGPISQTGRWPGPLAANRSCTISSAVRALGGSSASDWLRGVVRSPQRTRWAL